MEQQEEIFSIVGKLVGSFVCISQEYNVFKVISVSISEKGSSYAFVLARFDELHLLRYKDGAWDCKTFDDVKDKPLFFRGSEKNYQRSYFFSTINPND
jgi:hypothetical protein